MFESVFMCECGYVLENRSHEWTSKSHYWSVLPLRHKQRFRAVKWTLWRFRLHPLNTPLHLLHHCNLSARLIQIHRLFRPFSHKSIVKSFQHLLCTVFKAAWAFLNLTTVFTTARLNRENKIRNIYIYIF